MGRPGGEGEKGAKGGDGKGGEGRNKKNAFPCRRGKPVYENEYASRSTDYAVYPITSSHCGVPGPKQWPAAAELPHSLRPAARRAMRRRPAKDPRPTLLPRLIRGRNCPSCHYWSRWPSGHICRGRRKCVKHCCDGCVLTEPVPSGSTDGGVNLSLF